MTFFTVLAMMIMLNVAANDDVAVEDSDYDGSEDNDGAKKS